MYKFRYFLVIWAIAILAFSAEAAKVGKANLEVKTVDVTSPASAVQVGDVISVALFASSNELVTGAEVYLEFDDQFLELIPSETASDDIRPFQQGPFLRGSILANSTLDDVIGNSNFNKFPLFQLYYKEVLPVDASGAQRASVGGGVIATAEFRVIQRPESGATEIRVLRTSPFGSETGYFLREDPGSLYAFDQIQNLSVMVQEPVTRVAIQAADFDGSGAVDFSDFLTFASAFGSAQGAFDMDGSGVVDFPDFLKFVRVYGQSVSP